MAVGLGVQKAKIPSSAGPRRRRNRVTENSDFQTLPVMVKRKRGTNGTSRRSHKKRKMTTAVVKKIIQTTIEKSEPKVFRLSSLLVGSYVNGSDTNQSIVEIAQGDGANQRIGSKCRIARIYIKLRIRLDGPTTGQSTPMTIRIGLDHVKAGVLESAGGLPARGFFTKPDYVSVTQRVLWDKTFSLSPRADGDMDGQMITFSKMITLKNHQVRWKATGADDPEDGNLLLWAFAECPGSADQSLIVEDHTDVYFSEV